MVQEPLAVVKYTAVQNPFEDVKAMAQLLHAFEIHRDAGVARLGQPLRGGQPGDDLHLHILAWHFFQFPIRDLFFAIQNDPKGMAAVNVPVELGIIQAQGHKTAPVVEGDLFR